MAYVDPKNKVKEGTENGNEIDDLLNDLGIDFVREGWLEAIDIAHVIVDLTLPKSRAITATSVEAFGYGTPIGIGK